MSLSEDNEIIRGMNNIDLESTSCVNDDDENMSLEYEFTDEQHAIYSSYFMYQILMNNNKNIEDPDFINIWKKFGNIDTAQLVDQELYKEQFINDILPNIERCMVLFKNSYKDAKIGDTINSGKVIGVFTLTVWILLDDDNIHDHCCPSQCCSGCK